MVGLHRIHAGRDGDGHGRQLDDDVEAQAELVELVRRGEDGAVGVRTFGWRLDQPVGDPVRYAVDGPGRLPVRRPNEYLLVIHKLCEVEGRGRDPRVD